MILLIDVGNTNIVLGIHKNDEYITSWRISTDAKKTSDEYSVQVMQLFSQYNLNPKEVEGVIISSVVPNIMHSLENMIRKCFGKEPIIVGPGIKTGINIKYDNPKEVGADRIVNAVATYEIYKKPNIVIDFGTATNQQTTSKTYNNYITKRQKEIDEGANHFDASTVRQGNNKVYTIDENFKFEILYNYYYNNKAKTENDYSVCTLFTHNDKNFLFTGDLEKDGEDRLVDNNTLPEVNLFKAGHHGSKTSSNEKLLSVIKPKIVCVCCCAGSCEYTSTNVNQFPTQAFIDRVSLYTIYVYVTTLCVDYENNEYTSMNGNITVISHLNDPNISMDFSNNSTVLKDTEWFKANRTWPEN